MNTAALAGRVGTGGPRNQRPVSPLVIFVIIAFLFVWGWFWANY